MTSIINNSLTLDIFLMGVFGTVGVYYLYMSNNKTKGVESLASHEMSKKQDEVRVRKRPSVRRNVLFVQEEGKFKVSGRGPSHEKGREFLYDGKSFADKGRYLF